jgi:NAD-dependent SIR2 family protein deacetylase
MKTSTDALREFLDVAGTVTVLTGAGVSTGSGIPDYRDRNGDWKHAQPMQFHEFAGSETARQRYWARSYVGWRRFGRAEPNAAHRALAKLESKGKVDTLITQNVDRLHSRAGSRQVIDLHGDLGRVVCLACGDREPRQGFQRRLADANAGWHAEIHRYKPDGDAELAEKGHQDFRVPGCRSCDGVVKPDVVMFGESVPRNRVTDAMAAVERSDALLVVGSSLIVFSGFRFAKRARELQKPIAIVNRGKTRADELAAVKIDEDCRQVLDEAVRVPRDSGKSRAG